LTRARRAIRQAPRSLSVHHLADAIFRQIPGLRDARNQEQRPSARYRDRGAAGRGGHEIDRDSMEDFRPGAWRRFLDPVIRALLVGPRLEQQELAASLGRGGHQVLVANRPDPVLTSRGRPWKYCRPESGSLVFFPIRAEHHFAVFSIRLPCVLRGEDHAGNRESWRADKRAVISVSKTGR